MPTKTCNILGVQIDLDTSGVTEPNWKAVATEIIIEITSVQGILGYFDTINKTQNALFLDENEEFPQAADMFLPKDAADKTSPLVYVNLFATILKAIGTVTGQPEIKSIGGAIGGVASAVAALSSPSTSTFKQNIVRNNNCG